MQFCLGKRKSLGDFLGNSSENKPFGALTSLVGNNIPHSARTDKQSERYRKSMALDIRLECLMIAINEDCSDLEAKEVNDTLVVRVRDGSKIIEPVRRGRPPRLHQPE